MPIKYNPRVYTEVKGNEHRLVLNPVRSSDFGMYTCIANNSFGFDARHIELTGEVRQTIIYMWHALMLMLLSINSITIQFTEYLINFHLSIVDWWQDV